MRFLLLSILTIFLAQPVFAGGDSSEDTEKSDAQAAKPTEIKRLYLPRFSITVANRGTARTMYAYSISLELADMDNAETTVNMMPKIQDAMLSYLVKVSHLAPHLLENQSFIRRKLRELINETLTTAIGNDAVNTVVIEKLSKRPV